MRILLFVLTTILALAPSLVRAQEQGKFRFSPSLAVGESHDDNIFASAEKNEEDWITVITPSLETAYMTRRFSLTGRYSMDAEKFRDHTELSKVFSRQDAGLDMLWAPSERLRMKLRSAYTETNTAAELTLLTGLDLGRQRAERLDAGSGLEWKFGDRSEATIDYEWTRDRITGGLRGDTQTGAFVLERRLSARSAGSLVYKLRRFDFDGAPGITAHFVGLGWTADFGRRSRLTLVAGPRLEQGMPATFEGDGSFRAAVGRGEVVLAASQLGTRVIGLAGEATTQSASLSLGLVPWRRLRIAVVPAVYRTELGDATATVRHLGVEAGLRLASWLAFEVSQQWSLQTGLLGGGTLAKDIRHDIFLVRLVAPSPERHPRRLPVDRRGAPDRSGRETDEEEDGRVRRPVEEEGSEP